MAFTSWIQAIRPLTLIIGASSVFTAYASVLKISQGQISASPQAWLSLIACLVIITSLQAAANLINDAEDAKSGVDQTEGRTGPQRVVASGLLSAKQVTKASLLLILLALSLGIGMCLWLKAYPLIGVGLGCALAVYAYSAGPFPFSRWALGEIAAYFFFGPLCVGACAWLINAAPIENWFFWGSGPGLLAAAVMSINNLRDREGDRNAGRKTLAILGGERMARQLPKLFIATAIVMFVAVFGKGGREWDSASTVAILMMLFFVVAIAPSLRGEGQILNKALANTSKLGLFYALLGWMCVLV